MVRGRVAWNTDKSRGSLGGRLLARVPGPLSPQASSRLQPTVKRWVGRLGARVRDALDLPSRSELAEALVRLDSVQDRLDLLAETQIRDLGEQVAGLKDKQSAGDKAVLELAADHDKVLAIRRKLKRELKAAGKTIKKPKKAKDKPEINVGSPKAMKERKQAKAKAKAKSKPQGDA